MGEALVMAARAPTRRVESVNCILMVAKGECLSWEGLKIVGIDGG